MDEHLVVDGWIEDGGYPVVKLTSSIAVCEGEMSEEDLRRHVLNWATVTVSDGEQTVTLMGMQDDRFFPPYIYTTYNMKGQAGKTYTLDVKYGKTTASAVTTIPAPEPLDTLYATKTADGYTLRAEFTPSEDAGYMCYSRRDGVDSSYKMCQFSLVDGNAVREHTMLIVFPGFSVVSDQYQKAFDPGEHVSVRFCKMDRQSYDFWKGYMDEWIFSRNPFFPVSANPQSNVVGGYGIWAGYGATYYEIDIPE